MEGEVEDPTNHIENIHVFYNNLPLNYNKESCINDTKLKRDYILYLIECIRADVTKATDIVNNGEVKEKQNELKYAMKSLESKVIKLNNELHYLDRKKYCGLSILQISSTLSDMLSYTCAVLQNNKWLFPHVGKLITSSEQNHFDDIEEYKNVNIENAGYIFVFNIRIRTAFLSILYQLLMIMREFLYASTNKSYQPPSNTHPRYIINWKVLYKLILLTFPYLDQTSSEYVSSSSISVYNSSFSRLYSMNHYTITVIIQCSNFYIQEDDATSSELWDMVKEDIYMNHSSICSRAAILLYIFLPSKCSVEYYTEKLPIWYDIWKNTDNNISWDGIWVNIFCSARKYLPYQNFDWKLLLQHLLTNCLSWLNIPVGGRSNNDFPSPAQTRQKSFPRLFTSLLDFDLPSSSNSTKENEFTNFIRKITKIIFFVLTHGDALEEVVKFISFLNPYFNASNYGYWTYPLGIFLQQFCYEFVDSVGIEYGLDHLRNESSIYATLVEKEPYLKNMKWDVKNVVLLLNAMLPTCQNAICSKNASVAVSSVYSLLSLIEIDPYNISITFLDFSRMALESVTLSHQIPSVLSLLSRLVQVLLRRYPEVWLGGRLVDVMNLALAGLDCNDKDKTYKTFKFFKTVLSWVPIGDIRSLDYNLVEDEGCSTGLRQENGILQLGSNLIQTNSKICNTPEYINTINTLSSDTLLTKATTANEDIKTLLEETSTSLSDWSLAVLDRIFLLFHSTGPREKSLKHTQRAKRMTHRDMKKGRNESIIFYEFCEQFMACLYTKEDRDMVCKIIARFLVEDICCIHAVKNVALLCRSLCYVRNMDGDSMLNDILPKLYHDLQSKSTTTIQYYVRCISGCVRNSGRAVVSHQEHILKTLDFTLSLEDKKCFKAGCKLLRHLLLNVQCYPYLDEFFPLKETLGKSAQFYKRKKMQWHIPTGQEIDFAVVLLERYVVQPIRKFWDEGSQKVGILRKFLKVIRYSLRGCTSILLDAPFEETASKNDVEMKDDVEYDSDEEVFDNTHTPKLHPHEEAMRTIIKNSSKESQALLQTLRATLSKFTIKLISFITSTYYEFEQKNDIIGNDHKISRELIQISSLLLKSRYHSPSNYSSTSKKQESFNKLLSRQVHFLETVYAKYGLLIPASLNDPIVRLHSDGEDGGKIISQRTHVLICMKFYEGLVSQASIDIPRRLWVEYAKYSNKNMNLFDCEVQSRLNSNTEQNVLDESIKHHPISYYAALIDSLFALSYHHKSDVRSEAVKAMGHVADRYGFIIIKRLLLLLEIFSFNNEFKGSLKYGIPSINGLIQKINEADKESKHVSTLKMRLSEICLSLSTFITYTRSMKALYLSQPNQLKFLSIFHKSEYLLKFLPDDATQKMIMSYQKIFLVYRSQWFSDDSYKLFQKDVGIHKRIMDFVIDLLCDGWDGSKELTESKADDSNTMAHWRNRLLMGWFLTIYVQEEDVYDLVSTESTLNTWTLCCHLIISEVGQPIQRLALGLFGKIITFIDTSYNLSLLSNDGNSIVNQSDGFSKLLYDKLLDEKFSRAFIQALVYDHREDRQVTGNAPAQWTAGVEDILNDATKNLSPSIIFPFVNVGRNSVTFKVQHAQLIQSLLTCLGFEKVMSERTLLSTFLTMALELANAPPSEDQKNCKCTAAEIFAGVGRFLVLTSPDRQVIWETALLPFLDKVITIIPMDIIAAFCDSMRFIIHRLPPTYFYPLINWLMLKVEKTLWQYSKQDSDDNDNDGSIESFTLQTKWLSLLNYALSEITWDYSDSVFDFDDFKLIWVECICGRLLPRLLNAMGHPYDQCRNTISSTLLRICQCQRKLEALKHLSTSKNEKWFSEQNPGEVVIKFMLSKPFHEDHIRVHYQFLLTIRTFMFHCIQSGDCEYESLQYVHPLMSLAFEYSVFNDSEPNSDKNEGKETNGNEAINTSNRILEAEVSKAFRFALATIASCCLMTHQKHEENIDHVLDIVNEVISKENQKWQIRQVAVNFLRCFQGSHRIIFSESQTEKVLGIVIKMLADERREVSSAASVSVTGILAGAPIDMVSDLVQKYSVMARKSLPVKKRKKKLQNKSTTTASAHSTSEDKEIVRRKQQQTSVLFLCACVHSQPYDTPSYVPPALAALSKHSFDTTSSYVVREAVKHCCSEYKKTHMSENWETHRMKFTQEELESLEDVVSTPHYYA